MITDGAVVKYLIAVALGGSAGSLAFASIPHQQPPAAQVIVQDGFAPSMRVRPIMEIKTEKALAAEAAGKKAAARHHKGHAVPANLVMISHCGAHRQSASGVPNWTIFSIPVQPAGEPRARALDVTDVYAAEAPARERFDALAASSCYTPAMAHVAERGHHKAEPSKVLVMQDGGEPLPTVTLDRPTATEGLGSQSGSQSGLSGVFQPVTDVLP